MAIIRNALPYIAVTALLAVPSRGAATTFDFNGGNTNLGTTASFTVDGIQVDVSGYSYARVTAGTNPINTWYAANITRVSNALAIDHGNTFVDITGSHIDNFVWYDLLVFALPENVAPVSVGFSALQELVDLVGNDDWIVGWSDTFVSPAGSPNVFFGGLASGTGGFPLTSFVFPGPLDPSRSYLYIGGMNLTSVVGNDDFRVDSLEVQAVPEPGTLLMIGAGLTGLALRRRRPGART